jgi:biotin carboxyl carrier protein
VANRRPNWRDALIKRTLDKMSLKASVGGESFDLLIREQDGKTIVELGERTYELTVSDIRPGQLVLISENQVFNCLVSHRGETEGSFEVQLRGQSFEVSVSDPRRLRSGGGLNSVADGSAQIVAPMPGKVVRVLVEPGQEVEAGTGIVVVEAMKMQNELKSPKSGTVSSVSATEGMTVNAGDLLAVIE